jgi:2-oxoglutarate ferredoxin oxidoreductase subunit alpha
MAITIIDGNEAVARAAMEAGCNFFAGYPITPATSILQHMLQFLPPAGGVCMQGEDEIGSIGFCLGAAVAGAKAMTATSGPGISLCSEQISFAIGAEIPLVIVDVQRLGPSTGSATKGADGDIQFLRWASSGGLPVIVLAPVDVADCYLLTIRAFTLALRYRCPVFIASNKEIGMTRESLDLKRISLPETVELDEADESVPALPPIVPMGGELLCRITSSSHGPDGYITTDPAIIAKGINRLSEKLRKNSASLSSFTLDGDREDRLLIICYGVSARAARQATAELRKSGLAASLLVLKTLYPVAEDVIKNAIRGKEKIVVVEMNCGQYLREIERLAGSVPVTFVGQMNGELLSPATITRQLRSL